MNAQEFQTKLNAVFERACSVKGAVDQRLKEPAFDLSAPYTRLFIKKVPKSILELGVRNGDDLVVWRNVFKDLKLVGIDIVDHMPNKRVIGIDKHTHPEASVNQWEFIQGNALDRNFAAIISHFDMITQNCDYDKHSAHHIIKIFENFFQKSDYHYVIEGIKGEVVGEIVYKHIKKRYPNISIELYKTPYSYFHSKNSETGYGVQEYIYALFITK